MTTLQATTKPTVTTGTKHNLARALRLRKINVLLGKVGKALQLSSMVYIK